MRITIDTEQLAATAAQAHASSGSVETVDAGPAPIEHIRRTIAGLPAPASASASVVATTAVSSEAVSAGPPNVGEQPLNPLRAGHAAAIGRPLSEAAAAAPPRSTKSAARKKRG